MYVNQKRGLAPARTLPFKFQVEYLPRYLARHLSRQRYHLGPVTTSVRRRVNDGFCKSLTLQVVV